MEDKIKEEISIIDYIEDAEDKNYNRYISNSISGLNWESIRKVVHFEKENMYIVYTNNTLTESIVKWLNQRKG